MRRGYLLVGWLLHCLLTDVRYHSDPPTAYLHVACLAIVILSLGLDEHLSGRWRR